jgi:hypothetical protein
VQELANQVNGQIGCLFKHPEGIKQFALSAVFALVNGFMVQGQTA